jgi:hypothetical protein
MNASSPYGSGPRLRGMMHGPTAISLADFIEDETAIDGGAGKPRKSGKERDDHTCNDHTCNGLTFAFASGCSGDRELRAAPTQIPKVSARPYRRGLLTLFVASNMSVSGRSERGPRSKLRSTRSSLSFSAHLVISLNPAFSKEKCRIFSS